MFNASFLICILFLILIILKDTLMKP